MASLIETLLGGQQPDLLSGNYGLNPLQQSLDQLRPQPRGFMGALQGLGGNISSALGKADPAMLALMASAMLQQSGPQPGRTSFGQRLGNAVGQATPQILNQQSIKERTALQKQEIEQRKASLDMESQQHQITLDVRKGVQERMGKFLDRAIPGDVDDNGILDANEKAALPLAKLAFATGLPEYEAKWVAAMNPGEAKAGSPVGKLAQDLANGIIDKAQFDEQYAALNTPGVQVNVGTDKPLSADDLLKLTDDQGNHPPLGSTMNSVNQVGGYTLQTERQQTGKAQAEGVTNLLGPAFSTALNAGAFPKDDASLLQRTASGVVAGAQTKTQDPKKPEFRKYEIARKAVLSNLARIGGQTGALTQRDVDTIDSLFPVLGFTPESLAIQSFDTIREMLLAKGMTEAQLQEAGFPSAAEFQASGSAAPTSTTGGAEYDPLGIL